MPTYAKTPGFQAPGSKPIFTASDYVARVEAEVDFAAVAVARTAAGQAALTTNDRLLVLNMPKGSIVQNAGVEVITAEGGVATADLGFATDTSGGGGTANQWGTAVNLNVVGLSATLAAPHLCIVDSYMFLTLANAVDAAKVKVFMTISYPSDSFK